jgi:hypothetical protein
MSIHLDPNLVDFHVSVGRRLAHYEDLEQRLSFLLEANERLGSYPYLIPEDSAYSLKASLERCHQSRELHEQNFSIGESR